MNTDKSGVGEVSRCAKSHALQPRTMRAMYSEMVFLTALLSSSKDSKPSGFLSRVISRQRTILNIEISCKPYIRPGMESSTHPTTA